VVTLAWKGARTIMPRQQLAEHITALDWEALQHTLDDQGYAHIPNLLDPEQCHDIAWLTVDRYKQLTKKLMWSIKKLMRLINENRVSV
jgi:hypothetical protein